MSVDGATASPEATEGGRRGRKTGRDPYRFLSTRLVRELIAADARAESMEDDRGKAHRRLLEVIAEGLAHAGGILLDPEDLGEMASREMQPGEVQLLTAPNAGAPLLRRAALEQSAFLLGPASPEPLLTSLRRVRAQWTSLVVVPLCLRRRCIAILVLASTGKEASVACLQSLAPAFRLLAHLLQPSRRVELAAGEMPDRDGELERSRGMVEELRARLAESEEQRRELSERESSLGATQRAEVESLRARVSELEADGASRQAALARCEELERETRRLSADLLDREGRIAELEMVHEPSAECVEDRTIESEDVSARVPGGMGEPLLVPTEVDPVEAVSLDDVGDVGSPVAELGEEESLLGEIAAAAAAALDEDGCQEDSVADSSLETMEGSALAETATGVLDLEVLSTEERQDALWHLDPDPTSRAWVEELAARAGIQVWTGEGDPPPAARKLLCLNLFEASVVRAAELIASGHDIEGVVYALDSQDERGFELGTVGWVARPLDPGTAVDRLRDRVGDRLSGIVIASAELREMAAFRKALAAAEIAGSVACDLRQATDLLEIVGTPDAVLIDLALEGGQGLALARHLRSDDQTSSVPILFLLPSRVQADTFRRDAESAGLLEPYGDDDARRLLNGALATLR